MEFRRSINPESHILYPTWLSRSREFLAWGNSTTFPVLDRWFDGSMVRWFDGSLAQWIAGSMDRWFDGSMVQWIAGSVDRWFDGCKRSSPHIGFVLPLPQDFTIIA